MRKYRIRNGSIVSFILTGALIVLLAVLNIQMSVIVEHFNSDSQPAGAAAVSEAGLPAISSLPSFDAEAELVSSRKSNEKTIAQQLENRTRIDDFLAPDLWEGTAAVSENGSITITSVKGEADSYRKYDGLLDLKTYIYMDIEVKNIEPVSWMTLYLMEDLDYANYFEFDLREVLKQGASKLVINKHDFLVGSGAPEWNEISAIKIAYGTEANAVSTIKLNEISTYEARPMCSIWFDDGWKSTYTDAYPVMKEKNIKGILSVVSSCVGSPAFVSESELNELYSSGWDLTNHTYDHKDLSSLTAEEVKSEILNCYGYLESHGYSRAAGNVVPPYCATSEAADEVISAVALTSRVVPSKYNCLPVTDPYHLGFREVFSDTPPETAMQWIDEAEENDLWLVLLFHSIGDEEGNQQVYGKENFKKIIDYLYEKQSGISVVTLSEALGADIIHPSAERETETDDKGRKLVWEEDFTGGLDSSVWNCIDAAPFKNNELQTYKPGNVKTQNGMLNITSAKENGGYFSGAVTTENKRLFQYGRVEIRAKLPSGKGIFPALWMLPQSGSDYPEIDIIEYLGDKPGSIWHVMHYEKNGKKQKYSAETKGAAFDDGFHVYALDWSQSQITWLIDGAETYSVSGYVPSDKMYLYINTAIGGDWPGSPDSTTQFPQTMLIDYIKYYR